MVPQVYCEQMQHQADPYVLVGIMVSRITQRYYGL